MTNQFLKPESLTTFLKADDYMDKQNASPRRAYSLYANPLLACSNCAWREEEDLIIRQYYASEGKAIEARLPGRTVAALQARAYKLGVSARPGPFPGARWTEEEDKILKQHYPYEGYRVNKRIPWRSKQAIITRATNLGVKRDYGPREPSGLDNNLQFKRRRTLHY